MRAGESLRIAGSRKEQAPRDEEITRLGHAERQREGLTNSETKLGRASGQIRLVGIG